MQIMLYLLTNLARVLLFAFYLFFTYKCLLRPPEKVATSQRAAYSQFIAATRRQFRRAPTPVWALPHWINSASRRRGKKKSALTPSGAMDL
jgi:hypothetical protein